jgi:hypothetical protein
MKGWNLPKPTENTRKFTGGIFQTFHGDWIEYNVLSLGAVSGRWRGSTQCFVNHLCSRRHFPGDGGRDGSRNFGLPTVRPHDKVPGARKLYWFHRRRAFLTPQLLDILNECLNWNNLVFLVICAFNLPSTLQTVSLENNVTYVGTAKASPPRTKKK